MEGCDVQIWANVASPLLRDLENRLLELQGQSKEDKLVREMKAVFLQGLLSPLSNRGSGSHFIMDRLPWCHVTRSHGGLC